MKNSHLQSARRFATSLLLVPLFMVGQSCTDLTETPHDALTPDNAFKTDAELLAGVAGVYAQLRSFGGNGSYTSMEDLTADVSIVPTRGSDWFDNGQWLDMHRQTFTPSSNGTGGFLVGHWNDPFAGIAKANLMIDVLEKSTSASKASTIAELRTLRAFYYYMLMNEFGGVPLVTTTELKRVARSTRAEVFTFIETELKAAIPDLPATRTADGYGRVTKSVANAILASLYINAGVFTKECATGTGCTAGFSATSYNTCNITVNGQNACDAAIAAANAVINSGNFSLEPAGEWAQNFALDNEKSTENIFVIVYTAEGTAGLGSDWPMRTLHYNQLNTGWGSPWNGFATLAETYNKFDAGDERRAMWLQGQAYSFETGAAVNDRTGNPLIFTVSIPDATQASEGTGVRFNKYPPKPSAATGSGHPNDMVLFRLSEMYLIRAEANNEKGNLGAALTDLQAIHNLRDPGNPVVPASQAAMRDAIMNERVLEFAGEGKRRTDMIRAGTYTSWTEASANGVSATQRPARVTLYPIPAAVIGANSLLTQNPGY